MEETHTPTTPTFDNLPHEVAALREDVKHLTALVEQLIDMRGHQHSYPEIMSIEEAAQMLNFKKNTLYDMTSKGTIPFKKRGNKLFFDRDELLAWVRNSDDVSTRPRRKKSAESEAKENVAEVISDKQDTTSNDATDTESQAVVVGSVSEAAPTSAATDASKESEVAAQSDVKNPLISADFSASEAENASEEVAQVPPMALSFHSQNAFMKSPARPSLWSISPTAVMNFGSAARPKLSISVATGATTEAVVSSSRAKLMPPNLQTQWQGKENPKQRDGGAEEQRACPML